MGTATTMNSLTEVLGMSLPGSAAIPAPHRDRQENAYETGRQIVEMIRADRTPSDILTRASFLNAIRVNSAIGGSTKAPIHLIALAHHLGVELSIDDWQSLRFKCRCWSACNPRVSTWARIFIAPAGFQRSSPS